MIIGKVLSWHQRHCNLPCLYLNSGIEVNISMYAIEKELL